MVLPYLGVLILTKNLAKVIQYCDPNRNWYCYVCTRLSKYPILVAVPSIFSNKSLCWILSKQGLECQTLKVKRFITKQHAIHGSNQMFTENKV